MKPMASGITCGRVRTKAMTATESLNKASILQVIDMQSWFTVYFFDILDIHIMIN